MGAIQDRAAAIVADLAGAGLRATRDPDSINPPTLFLDAPVAISAPVTLSGARRITWELWALAPSPANLGALDSLTGLLEAVIDHGTGAGQDEGWNPGSKPLPGMDAAPGYFLRWTELLTPTPAPPE